MEPTIAEAKALPPGQPAFSSTPPHAVISQKQLRALRIAEDLLHPPLLALLAQLAGGAEIEVTGDPDDVTVRLPLQPGDRFIVPFSGVEKSPNHQSAQAA